MYVKKLANIVICTLLITHAACNFSKTRDQSGVSNDSKIANSQKGDGEGFMGGDGEGFMGVIPRVYGIFVPTLSDIPKDSRLRLLGLNFKEGITVKVSDVACTNVLVKSNSELECTLEENAPNATTVKVKNIDSIEKTYQPLIYTDTDRDFAMNEANDDSNYCPRGTCKGPDCITNLFEAYCIVDNCPYDFNPGQCDDDGDGIGNACDNDFDRTVASECEKKQEGYDEFVEKSTGRNNSPPIDIEGGVNFDSDNDGTSNILDNCPDTSNENQEDANNNGIGDACDYISDSDGDEVNDSQDNCPTRFNTEQEDSDIDGIGDACDATVTSIEVPTITDLPKDSLVTVRGNNFMEGIFITISGRTCANYSNTNPCRVFTPCQVISIASSSQLVCKTLSAIKYVTADPTFAEYSGNARQWQKPLVLIKP